MTNLWKEASTLIMIARASKASKVSSSLSQNLKQTSKVAQEAGQPIMKSTENSSGTDYRLLMAERSKMSKFMPSAYVFPGGQIEVSDSQKWWEIFKRFGFNREELTRNIRARVSGPKPTLIKLPLLVEDALKSGNLGKDHLVPEIALRIAAIRETFEEVGIPILRKLNDNSSKESENATISTNIDLRARRDETQNNGSSFLDLCWQLNLCPDIWALYEWWEWLTPASFGSKRFDTMFYLCCVDEQPEVVADNAEVTNLKWCTPEEVLMDHEEKKVFLAPPQAYELARMKNFKNFDEIREFAKKREKYGVERWLPVKTTYSDGSTLHLPGDDFYPAEPDVFGTGKATVCSQTLEEMKKKSKNINRIDLIGPVSRSVCNCELFCGHLPPVAVPSV